MLLALGPSIVFLGILIGIYFRNQRALHIPIMLAAFVVDLCLLLYLEFSRSALKTAAHPPHPFVLLHVALALGTLIFYFIQIVTGIRILFWNASTRRHWSAAWIFVILRAGTLLTSFWVSEFVSTRS